MLKKVIIAAIAIAWCGPLFGDTGPQSTPDVVAFIVPGDADAEAFSSVISGALGLRLSARGLTSDIRSLPSSGSTHANNDALVRQVGPSDAGSVIICRISVVGGDMTAAMDWQDIPAGVHAAVSGEEARVDLTLDAFIVRVLDSLLSQVGDRVDQMAAKRSAVEAAAAEKAAADKALADKAAEDKAAEDKAAAERQPPVLRPAVEDDTVPHPFLLSTGVAPFIPVGQASTYFSLGYMVTAVGNVAFQMPAGRIGAGISLGALSFTTQGAAGATTVVLVPIGLQASYRLGASTVAGVLFDLSGGAAILFVSSPTVGTKAKTVPYVRGAVGVEVLFSRTVGVLLDTGYEVYFEMPQLIMGVTPALEVSLRL
jgi:hypothetical protein